jgi:hypothetical protein
LENGAPLKHLSELGYPGYIVEIVFTLTTSLKDIIGLQCPLHVLGK